MDRNQVEQFRLALFGRMVMGVSHEVDNHLSVILGFAELIQISAGGDKKMLEGAEKILNAGVKINTIMKHFSHYVRPHAPEPEPFSLAEMLRECLIFARYDLGRNNVSLAFPEKWPQGILNVDRRDLALALMALFFNGSEAMTAKGGTLRLDASHRDGEWELLVSDEGPGIPPGIFPRIFEPGFTTKGGPYHSGMGLPVARHIVSGMGGTLTLENPPSGGCSASIRVPGRP